MGVKWSVRLARWKKDNVDWRAFWRKCMSDHFEGCDLGGRVFFRSLWVAIAFASHPLIQVQLKSHSISALHEYKNDELSDRLRGCVWPQMREVRFSVHTCMRAFMHACARAWVHASPRTNTGLALPIGLCAHSIAGKNRNVRGLLWIQWIVWLLRIQWIVWIVWIF